MSTFSKKTKALLPQNWLSLISPYEYKGVSIGENTSVFEIEPLEEGLGLTIGNSLRRIMLSHICGAAITAAEIEGVSHEYSTIKGIKEDVLEILLNLKSVVVATELAEGQVTKLECKGPMIVTAKEIVETDDLSIVNKDLVICHLGEGASIKMKIYISSGRGYLPSEKQQTSAKLPSSKTDAIGLMKIDAVFSPVEKVSYVIEKSRVGANTLYDKLKITIKTKGNISPEMALSISAKILQTQLNPFVTTLDNMPQTLLGIQEDELTFPPQLLLKIDALEWSVRSHNCFKNSGFVYLGDVVTKTETEILKTPNFGKKSLNETKEALKKMGLTFGMSIQGWPPENIEELVQKYSKEIDDASNKTPLQ